MVPCADGNSSCIKYLSDIEMVNPLNDKRQHANFMFRSANQTNPFQFRNAFSSVLQQLIFVSSDVFLSKLSDEFHGMPESNHVTNVGCTCFKLVWKIVVGRFFESNFLDHLTATMI